MRVCMPVCRPEDILKVSIPHCIETHDLSVNLEMTVYRSGWLTRELSRLSLLPEVALPSFLMWILGIRGAMQALDQLDLSLQPSTTLMEKYGSI